MGSVVLLFARRENRQILLSTLPSPGNVDVGAVSVREFCSVEVGSFHYLSPA